MSKKAWTFSTLEAFNTCPRQFYHLRVAKDIVEPPSEAILWGSKVHEAFEERIKHGTALPEGMTQWEGLAKKINALPGDKHAEYPMAISESFEPAPWDSAWSRGIADMLIINSERAMVLDYKTGKRKITDQLALYAAYTFAHFPDVKVVQSGFVWLKEKSIDKEEFKKEDAPIIWHKFLPRVNQLEKAYGENAWPPKPSGLCKKFCSVVRCEYNGRR